MVPLNKPVSANTHKQGENSQVLGQPGQQCAWNTSPMSSQGSAPPWGALTRAGQCHGRGEL